LKRRSKIVLSVVGLLAVGAYVLVKRSLAQKETVEVETHAIVKKDLASIIQASGKIRPKTMVDVSAAVSGKVMEVAVKEGDEVKKGQLLLRIDPKPYQTQVEQLEASIASAKAMADQIQANLHQSKQDKDRMESLYEQQLVSLNDVQKARTAVDVDEARTRGAEKELLRLGANLSEAQHELTKVDVHSDIDGTVVALNIEAGENAFVGAFNNPATVLLSVADLRVIEAEVEVDETEAVRAAPGQPAELEVDAHPGWVFHGKVSEVGHSPLRLQTGGEREGTAFKVKISVLDTIREVRPGLTCSAKIRTDERTGALAVPIQALTLRKPDGAAPAKDSAPATANSGTIADDGLAAAASPSGTATPISSGPVKKIDEKGKVEGVFVVRDGVATFQRVTVGITGEKDFEVLTGLAAGDVIVTGPFKALRTLKSGDHVKPAKKKEKKPGEEGDEESDEAKTGASGA
jgi:HlyD family secretion protein